MTADKHDLTAYVLLTITVVIWGSSWPLGRWMVSASFGATAPPMVIATLRYVLVCAIFLLMLRLTEGEVGWGFAKQHWLALALMGFFSVLVYQVGYLFGELFTAASDASLVVATGPIWVLIFSTVALKEDLNRQKIIGTVLAFSGVLVIVGFSPNVNVENRLLGDALILMAAVSYGLYTVLLRKFFNDSKKAGEQVSSLRALTWISVYGLLFLTPAMVLTAPDYVNPEMLANVHLRIWLGIVYLATFSTVVAYLFYTEGVARLDASRAAIFINGVPMVGVLLSGLFLGERIDPIIHSVALVLVVMGVSLVNRNGKAKALPRAVPTSPTGLLTCDGGLGEQPEPEEVV